MDMTSSIQAKSDQKNAEDFLSGPQTFTIEKVTAGNADQPIEVHLVESPGKPYKPSKSMRRVMVAAWGKEASQYAGRHLTLYQDPTVKFGGMVVGGIKISHMSHIDKKASFNLTVTRGKKATHTVEPITGEIATPSAATIPDNVRETVERVKGTDSAADYIKWAHDNNAPDHIIEYIKTNLEENNA